MIGDRFYMREPSGHNRSTCMMIFWSLIGIFILQGIDSMYNHGLAANSGRVFEHLGLSLVDVKRGFIWQFLTFQFLHAGILHLVFNLFGLFLFGKAIEETLGTKKFLWTYFGSGVFGGILQMLLTWLLYPDDFATHVTMGASAGIMGVIALYAMINPYQSIYVYFFPVRAMWFLVGSALYSFYFTIVPTGGIAHAAHLGGLVFGVCYAKWFMHADWSVFTEKFRRRARPAPPRELVKTPVGTAFWKKPGKPMPPEEDIPQGDFMSKEVDPILDKISAHGIQSLTDRERRILEAARAKMAKR